jgi:hypothetical protein
MQTATIKDFLQNEGFALSDSEIEARLDAMSYTGSDKRLREFDKSVLKYMKAGLEHYSPSGLYIVQDGDSVFYVGKSQDILDRLVAHMGCHARFSGPSRLGRFILDNAPDSGDWTITALTVDEVAAIAKTQFSEHSYRVDQAEQVLIAGLRPALNRALTVNGCQAIPEKYKKGWDDEGAGAMRAVRAAMGE